MDQGTNAPFVKKRNVLLSSSAERTKTKCDSEKKVCFGEETKGSAQQ